MREDSNAAVVVLEPEEQKKVVRLRQGPTEVRRERGNGAARAVILEDGRILPATDPEPDRNRVSRPHFR